MQALAACTGLPPPSNDQLRPVWTAHSGLRYSPFCRHGKLRTASGLLAGCWRSSRWSCSALTEEHFLQTCYDQIPRQAIQAMLEDEENTHIMDAVANEQFHLQKSERCQNHRVLPLSWNSRNLTAVVVNFIFVGLVACPQAWAGTEVARLEETASWLGDVGDIKNGFVSAFLLIFFSEIGDKTFFIAALLASRKSNAAVFTGTFGALVAMTFISVFLGRTFHYIDGVLPFSLGNNEVPLDDLAAVVLLVYFGVSTLKEATSMKGSTVTDEQQEAELAIAGIGADGAGLQAVANTALATFALVFVAEWGDKSFFSTIALSAASSPLGVVSGAIVGHGVATVLAVLGGSFLSTYISEKVIAYIGGILFLIFAAVTLVEIVT